VRCRVIDRATTKSRMGDTGAENSCLHWREGRTGREPAVMGDGPAVMGDGPAVMGDGPAVMGDRSVDTSVLP